MQYPLLQNNWFGKALGFTCAWIWAPMDNTALSVCIIIGIALGHVYDTWALLHASRQLGKAEALPLSPDAFKAASRDLSYARFLFSAMGHLAKSGGAVQPAHIEAAEQIIQQSGADPRGRAQAIEWFNEGKDGHAALVQLARQCSGGSSAAGRQRGGILRHLCHAAALAPSDTRLAVLKQLGGLLGFAPALVGKEFGAARQAASKRSRASQTPPPRRQTQSAATGAGAKSGQPASGAPPPEVVNAYRVLDLTPCKSAAEVNMAEVKKAYRRMVARYHPDRLSARRHQQQPVTAGEQALAQQRMVEMRNALETIEAYVASGKRPG